MSKPKKKIGFIIGCVVLSVMLGISSYISLVVIGVVADENKNGTLVNGQSANINNTVVDNGNVPMDNVPALPNYNVGNNDVYNDNQSDAPLSGNNNPVQNNQTNNNSSSGTNHVASFDPAKVTKSDIVAIYALVMNKAKTDKPGFTKIEYQELPDGPENRVISEGEENVSEESIDKLFGFIEDLGVFVPKEKAESEPYIHEKGDADMSLFPVFSREKGSYLTDPNGIESFTCSNLSNGNIKIGFVLVPEDNPEPIDENSNISPSYTGAVFAPMSKARIDRTVTHPIITVFAKDIEYSLRYHDCYVEVEFNPNTMQIVNLKQIANVSIKGSGNVVGVGKIGLERQELISTVIIKDIQY